MTVIQANSSNIRGDVPRLRGKWLAVFLLVAFAFAGWFATNHFGEWKDRFVARRFRTIDPGLMYASGQINRHLLRDVLVENKIKVIIVLLGNEANDPDVDEEIAVVRDLNIERVHFYLSGDGTGEISQYAGAVAKMVECEKEKRPTLVHCSSGVQRSNAATYFFRVLVQHHTAGDALAEIESNGFDPSHNKELVPYLNANISKLAALLVEMKTIDKVPDPLPQIHL